jgi:hypothetical protein
MSMCSKCGAEMKDQQKYCKACGAGLSGAASSLGEKKQRIMTKEKPWVKPAMIAAALFLAVAGAWAAKGIYMSGKMGGHPMFPPHRDSAARLTNATLVREQSGEVRIPVKGNDDGKAHFYAYAAGSKTITFFVMKSTDGSFRTALDACVACNHAKLGYRQEGNLVVCNNCGMGFKPTDIGRVTGGCNPIAIEQATKGDMLVLRAKDLEAGAQYF